MTPIWELTSRQASDESWNILEAARAAHEDANRNLRYRLLAIPQQTVAWMRNCCRVRGLAANGNRAELIRRIVGDITKAEAQE